LHKYRCKRVEKYSDFFCRYFSQYSKNAITSDRAFPYFQPIVNVQTGKIEKVGASIAIDDFGSGFANFEHMTKIDGSLIINIDKNARLVVETIIVFARKLGKKIVAEYVHNKAVFNVVKELGIDYAQGYYLGKPEAEVLENFIFPE
jgi:EAL domain-containing protein (putative c-di-GMP-specific phosphodiesterase class I)